MKTTISRAVILRLAADAGLDPRTVKRAIDKGVDSLQSEAARERLREAAAKHDVKLE